MSSLVQTIDTRYGSYNSHSFSNGNTLPLTGLPFGMNYFSLQTSDNNGNWWFNPYEPVYQGIRLTHQPSPWLGDFSCLLISPVTEKPRHSSLFHRQSSYQLNQAIFRPDLLDIFSNRYHIHSQVSPSMYGARLRFDQVQGKKVSLILHAPGRSHYQKLSDKKIALTLYYASENPSPDFCMRLILQSEQALTAIYQLVDERQVKSDVGSGENLHLALDFDSSHLEICLATSFLSIEQAQQNLLGINSWEETQKEAKEQWNHLLGRIRIKDSQHESIGLFYHCLYRCLLFPQTFFEIDEQGNEWHWDSWSNQIKAGKFYTNNGYWDTFRSSYPLLALLYPEYLENFLEGILNHYKDTGFLPKWLSPHERGIMPGTLVDGVIADALAKGIASEFAHDLLEAMIGTSQAEDPNLRYGRHGRQEYDHYGYLPNSYHESVSHSLDYAYSDWAISQVASILGKQELALEYARKSLGYRQLFDKKTGYIRSKDTSGRWAEPFSPLAWGKDYAECSALQASLAPLHDIEGLIELMGGKEDFTDYLVQLCNQSPLFEPQHYGYEIHEMAEMAQAPLGQLAISNQPSFHIPYLFQWSLKPEYTAILIKQIRQKAFSSGFKAYPGDEDNGSLSAWYIFSCLGFYPVCPGKTDYAVGFPLFKHIQVALPNGQTLTIHTPQANQGLSFVKSILIDGKEVTDLHHHSICSAHDLTFHLSLLP